MLNPPIGAAFQSAALSMNATPGRSLRIPSTLQLNIAHSSALAIHRHRNGALAEERERYLKHCSQRITPASAQFGYTRRQSRAGKLSARPVTRASSSMSAAAATRTRTSPTELPPREK
jgi:hypothetical protein